MGPSLFSRSGRKRATPVGDLQSMFLLLHRWIWQDPGRSARKLFNFAEIESDGGRDLIRAAELTEDPTLRRLFTVHAEDEERHAALFRTRGKALLRSLKDRSTPSFQPDWQLNWVAPG